MAVTGAAGLAAAGNLLWGRTDDVASAQRALAEQFDAAEARGPATEPARAPTRRAGPASRPDSPLPGYPVARMDIPRVGEKWLVVEGVDEKHIKNAPGHYPGTAMPGEVGNFAVAGHRAKGLFWDLDRLRPGDAVLVRARKWWFIYRVTTTKVVQPKATEEVAPHPGRRNAAASGASLTLPPASPSSAGRNGWWCTRSLVRSQPRDEGPPPEMRR